LPIWSGPVKLQYSYAPFLSQHDYDAMLLFFAANEHRM
jgi:hypothetical protein